MNRSRPFDHLWQLNKEILKIFTTCICNLCLPLLRKKLPRLSLNYFLFISDQEARPGHVRVSASTGHVFKFFITPQYFNWSQDNTEAKSSLRRKNEAAMLRYRASLINQPSLPSWLKYHYSKDYKTGLLYGVPKLSAQYRLQIVATDRDTFETGKDN